MLVFKTSEKSSVEPRQRRLSQRLADTDHVCQPGLILKNGMLPSHLRFTLWQCPSSYTVSDILQLFSDTSCVCRKSN